MRIWLTKIEREALLDHIDSNIQADLDASVGARDFPESARKTFKSYAAALKLIKKKLKAVK